MTTTIANKRSSSPTTTPVETAPASKPAPAAAGDDHVEDLANAATVVTAAVVKRAPPATVAAAEKLVDTTLQGSPSTEQADEAALALIRLPNADYADSMKALAAQPGQLEKLLASVTPSTKDVLVRRLNHAGVLHAAPAPTPPVVSPRAPTPPSSPTILKDDPSLPKSLRQLAVDENVAKMPAFREQVAAYREAYGAAVDSAKTIADLRALGPMHPPQVPERLPSTTTSPADVKLEVQYQHARGLDVSDSAMTAKVADKARTLTGHAVAGFSIKAEGKAMVTLSGVAGAGVDVAVGRAADGTVSGGVAARGKVGSAELAVDQDGKIEGKVGVAGQEVTVNEEGLEVESSSTGPSSYGDKPAASKEAKGGVTVTKTGVGITGELAGTGGGVAIDELTGLTLEGKFNGVTGKATYNGDGMTYGVGIEHEFGTDDFKVEVEAEVEVGLQGVTKFDRDGFISTSNVGFYDRPPELGTKTWSKLSPEKRAEYGQQMWTEKEWNTANDLARPHRL